MQMMYFLICYLLSSGLKRSSTSLGQARSMGAPALATQPSNAGPLALSQQPTQSHGHSGRLQRCESAMQMYAGAAPPALYAQMSERYQPLPFALEESTSLDLALLHAAPLVWRVENRLAPLDHQSLSLDFKSEVKALWDILGRTEKQVRVRFDVASSSTLGEVLAIKPVALHLVCHADYDPYKRNAGVDVRAAVT